TSVRATPPGTSDPSPLSLHAALPISTRGTASKQLYFAAFVLGTTGLIALSHPELVLAPPFLAALGVLATATVLSLVIDWDVRSPAWSALVPVLDMVSVAPMRDMMRDSSIAVSLLVLIPVLWLAARVRMLGVAIAVVAVTVLIALPALLRAPHIDSLMIAHSPLLPFIVPQVGPPPPGAPPTGHGPDHRVATALQEQESLLEAAATSEQLLHNIIDS